MPVSSDAVRTAIGAYKAEKLHGTTRYSRRIRALRKIFKPEELTTEFPMRYAHVRYSLECKGVKIGERDTLIAAHALTIGATIVTRNTREFKRVPQLFVEDWENPSSSLPRQLVIAQSHSIAESTLNRSEAFLQ